MDLSPTLIAVAGVVLVLVAGLVIALSRRSKNAPALPPVEPLPQALSLRTGQATSQATVVARDLSLSAAYEKKLVRLRKGLSGRAEAGRKGYNRGPAPATLEDSRRRLPGRGVPRAPGARGGRDSAWRAGRGSERRAARPPPRRSRALNGPPVRAGANSF